MRVFPQLDVAQLYPFLLLTKLGDSGLQAGQSLNASSINFCMPSEQELAYPVQQVRLIVQIQDQKLLFIPGQIEPFSDLLQG